LENSQLVCNSYCNNYTNSQITYFNWCIHPRGKGNDVQK